METNNVTKANCNLSKSPETTNPVETMKKEDENESNTTNTMVKNYVPLVQRKFMNNKSLKILIDAILPLDFREIKHSESPERIAQIRRLREELETVKDGDSYGAIIKELQSYNPSIEDQILFTIENLLQVAENLGIGIGIDTITGSTFYYSKDGYWKKIEDKEIDTFLSIISQKSGFSREASKHPKHLKAIREQYNHLALIPRPVNDPTTIKINLKNGTFHISRECQKLKAFDSADFFTYVLPFEYDETAKAPKFQKYLDEVIPEIQAQMVMAEFLGYVFTIDLKLERCLVLVGDGCNGKSVYYDVVRALLGSDNICSYPLGSLTDETGYSRAKLVDKLLNYSSELGGKYVDYDKAKKLISNEPIDARLPYKDPFEIYNYSKFMFNTNLLPRNQEQTNGYFRRFMFLEFNVTIPEEKRDPDLAKKIVADELSGVFNWVIDGLKRLLAQGNFTKSPKIEAVGKRIQQESDSVMSFMDSEGYIPSVEDYETSKFLYEEYQTYCLNNGNNKVSSTEFLRRLDMHHFYIKRKCTNNETRVFCIKETVSNIDPKTQSVIEMMLAKNATCNN
ncbi:phage/plasmid primase, P4 family [Paludibacter sp.]|uniref:DNA primase family protein n=1 Tax=Paludibacter sp. TaxID=1898105 RepID=UPI0025E6A7FB|nr:phage/plasmid primase, P4 family [Paludibacter sp.]